MTENKLKDPSTEVLRRKSLQRRLVASCYFCLNMYPWPHFLTPAPFATVEIGNFDPFPKGEMRCPLSPWAGKSPVCSAQTLL